MAKSNMKSVGIRKHHRRIQHQTRIDNRERQEQMYKQKEYDTVSEKVIVSVAGICDRIIQYASRFVNRLFGKLSINLDLTEDSPFSLDRKRDAGAQYLRSMFPGLKTMVSTRDGKIIR